MSKSHSIKKGFTIIEVIIVLVIAAIIMVMVFLVVPQLNQSQRNTKRQNYARQLLAAVGQYYSNYGSSAATPNYTQLSTIAGVQNSPSTGAAYSPTAVYGNASTPAATTLDSISIATGASKCSGSTYAQSTTSGGASVVIGVEPSGQTFCVSDGN